MILNYDLLEMYAFLGHTFLALNCTLHSFSFSFCELYLIRCLTFAPTRPCTQLFHLPEARYVMLPLTYVHTPHFAQVQPSAGITAAAPLGLSAARWGRDDCWPLPAAPQSPCMTKTPCYADSSGGDWALCKIHQWPVFHAGSPSSSLPGCRTALGLRGTLRFSSTQVGRKGLTNTMKDENNNLFLTNFMQVVPGSPASMRFRGQ